MGTCGHLPTVVNSSNASQMLMHYLYYTVGEEAAAVESLRKKMMTNLENARDRVNFLCKHLFAFYIISLSYLMTISIIFYEEGYKLHSWFCVFLSCY